MPLKPQDILCALTLLIRDDPQIGYEALADATGLSLSESRAALGRGVEAGLLAPGTGRREKPRVLRAALLEFLTHGLRYAFPARPGGPTRGLPTGRSAPPLVGQLAPTDDLPLVWPDPEGTVRGLAIQPLYSTVSRAARDDDRLYELLALLDGLRCGSARERALATQELERRILP